MTVPDETRSAGRTIGARSGLLVGGAVGFSGAVAFIVMAFVPRAFSTEESTDFQTYWSALFAVFGVLTGLNLETTRAVAAARRMAKPAGPRAITVGVIVAVGIAALATATMPWWRSAILPPRDNVLLAVLLCVAACGSSIQCVLVGALAGLNRWAAYSVTIFAESALRLVAVLAAIVAGTTFGGVAAGAALGIFAWIAILATSHVARSAVASRMDAPARTLAGRMLAAVTAQGLSALLVVGFPLLLQATTPRSVFVAAAPLLLAITLTRAPLIVPLIAYQGVAVAHFVRHRDRGLRAAFPAFRLLAAIGAISAILAYLIGPALLALYSGRPEYRLPGLTLAALTLGAMLVALLSLSGSLCQALVLHRWFVAGWIAADAIAVLLLSLLPWSMESRSVGALLLAPPVGIAVHAIGLVRAGHVRQPAT